MFDYLIIVRILIVEDDERLAEQIRVYLDNIPPEEKIRLGISGFSFDLVTSVTEAKEKLTEAKAAGRPYHLMLLDLNLPLSKGDRETDPENGYKVLREARATGAAIETVIVSIFNYASFVARGFRGGALDFIAKPFERSELQDQVLASWKRVLEKLSDALLEERLRALIPYDEQVLAYRFGACFSGLTQDVVYEVEQLENELGERLGLNTRTDAQDSLLRHLEALAAAVRKSKLTWVDLQSMLPTEDEEPQKCFVADLFRELKTELLPCWKVKRVELAVPSGQAVEVLSFHEDVRVVLKEIIIGALCELPNYGEPERTLEIALTTSQEYAQVTFSGDLFHFDEQTKAVIEKGQRQHDGRFGQVWGLSVAQHIALRGGGRLQIGSTDQPDSVTYFIPLARHA